MTKLLLRAHYRIPTSGARGVTPFTVDGESYLAIPQLAMDAEGTPPGMNGGDSDTDLLVLRREPDGWAEHQRIAAPGGEDAEVFTIGEDVILAVASIRNGKGPYEYAVDSVIHRREGEKFVPYQSIGTYAAKQWRHFAIGERHFLALAQGVNVHPEHNRPSVIFEWDGSRFVEFQDIASQWAYNWHFLELDGEIFLAHADNVVASLLYRWDGHRFVEYQKLMATGGRAFASFTVDGRTYLACAVLTGNSLVYQWDGTNFVVYQVLEGTGGREFAVIGRGTDLYLVRVNFIRGTREQPETGLESQIYHWDGERLVDVEHFPTSGGTDAAVFVDDGELLVAVSNSLTPEVRFGTDTVIYAFEG
jgi:hypothetical protein